MIPDEFHDRLMEFAVNVARTADAMPATALGTHLAERLLACGLDAGSCYEHAAATERKAEFAERLLPAVEQLRRCAYWLRLAVRVHLPAGTDEPSGLVEECEQLGAILDQSVQAARGQIRRDGPMASWQAGDAGFIVVSLPFVTLTYSARRDQRTPGGSPIGAPKT